MLKKKTIYSLFFYIVFALFFIILKDEMQSIVANSLSTTVSFVSISRIYYVLLTMVLITYIFFFSKIKIKGRFLTSLFLLLVGTYFLLFVHSAFYPLLSNAFYVIALLPLLMLVFMTSIATEIDEKIFNNVFVLVFVLLVYFYMQSYDVRVEALYALTSSSAYVILYFLPFVLCGNSKVVKYIAIIATVVVILLSYKRAGIVSLAVALVLYSVVDGLVREDNGNKKSRKSGFFMLALLCIVCYMVFMGIEGENDNRLMSRFQSISEDKGSGRLDVYVCTWNMIMESDIVGLLFGHGWNSVLRDSPLKLSAHNDLLEVVYDYGLFVASIYIYMICQLVSYAKRLIKEQSRFAPAFCVSVVTFIINSMVSHILLYSNYMSVFTAFWAYAYIKNKLDKNDAMLIAIETGLIEPVATISGEILTDKNGTVIVM